MKTFSERHEELVRELVENIGYIRNTSELLPHPVYIEEEGEDKHGDGVPEYFRYQLVDIFPDGRCALLDSNGIRTHQYYLASINIDWLLTVWNRHVELLIENNAWKDDAIEFLQKHTDESLDEIIDFCNEHWQNLSPYTENLKAFLSRNE